MAKFEVIKEYAGIKKGSTAESNNQEHINYMVDNGYWLDTLSLGIEDKFNTETKVEPTKRKKKVITGKGRKKKNG